MSAQLTVGKFTNSSIGAKVVMAATGVLLYGFLIGHMLGNLTILMGPEGINSYAAGLRDLPFGALWIARIGLVVFFGLHIATAIKLTAQNRAARPVAYAYKNANEASYASRVMAMTGMLLLAYLIFHLATFTFHVGIDAPSLDAQGRTDVYSMVVASFQNPLCSLLYIVSMLVVGFHMGHGLAVCFKL